MAGRSTFSPPWGKSHWTPLGICGEEGVAGKIWAVALSLLLLAFSAFPARAPHAHVIHVLGEVDVGSKMEYSIQLKNLNFNFELLSNIWIKWLIFSRASNMHDKIIKIDKYILHSGTTRISEQRVSAWDKMLWSLLELNKPPKGQVRTLCY